MNQISKNIISIMQTRYSNHRYKIKETHTLQHPKTQITLAETLVSYFFLKSVNDLSAHKAMCYILKTNNDIYKHTETLNCSF